MNTENKLFMVVGGGRSGIAAASFLSGKKAKVLLTDTKPLEDIKKEEERYIENLDKNFIFQHECPHCKNNIEKEEVK